jgi:uncharacterized membrane protein
MDTNIWDLKAVGAALSDAVRDLCDTEKFARDNEVLDKRKLTYAVDYVGLGRVCSQRSLYSIDMKRVLLPRTTQ